MNSARWRKILAPLLISLVLFISACTPAQESRYSQVQKDTTQRGAPAAIAKKLNKVQNSTRFSLMASGAMKWFLPKRRKDLLNIK